MAFRHINGIRTALYVISLAFAGYSLPVGGTAYECRSGPTPENYNVAQVSEVAWRACRPINETTQGCTCASVRIEGKNIAWLFLVYI